MTLISSFVVSLTQGGPPAAEGGTKSSADIRPRTNPPVPAEDIEAKA
jgi:hypothetical protein